MSQNLMVNTYYDVAKTTLWGEKGNLEQAPRFVFSFRDGNPRFVVYTGEVGNVISFGVDYYTLGGILEAFNTVIDSAPGSRIDIDVTRFKWENNQRTNEKIIGAVLHFGKSKDGMLYISLISDGKPKLVFPFKKTDWHNFRDETGENLVTERESMLHARGYVRMLQVLSANMLAEYTKQSFEKSEYKPGEIDPKYNNGSGKKHSGNSGARKSYNNNSNNSSQEKPKGKDFDESSFTGFDADSFIM